MGVSQVGRARRDDRNITRVPLNQGAPGTSLLKSGVLGKKHSIVGGWLTLSADGTVKFIGSVTGDLTGPMDWAARGGIAIPQDDVPVVETAASEDLSIVTTLGAARGVVLISTE